MQSIRIAMHMIMFITMSISDDKFNDWNERQKKMKIIKMPLENNCLAY